MVSSSVLLLAIEGNIGVGKSTVIASLKAHFATDPLVVFVDEPVAAWEEHGLLEAMYSNKIGRATFQLMALTTRFGDIMKALNSNSDARLIITERSINSDRACFAEVNLAPDSPDRDAYNLSHDVLVSTLPRDIRHATVLLNTSRATMAARIAARGREAEKDSCEEENKGVPEPYLAALDAAHTAYYASLPPTSRRLVDASAAPEVVLQRVVDAIVDLEEHSSDASTARSPCIEVSAAADDDKENAPPTAKEQVGSPATVMAPTMDSRYRDADELWRRCHKEDTPQTTPQTPTKIKKSTIAKEPSDGTAHIFLPVGDW